MLSAVFYLFFTEIINLSILILEEQVESIFNYHGNSIYNAILPIRMAIWGYFTFCTFSKIRNTLGKSLIFVIFSVIIFGLFKWSIQLGTIFGFNLALFYREIMPYILFATIIFCVLFIQNKKIKELF